MPSTICAARALTVFAILSVLTACGGGGGSGAPPPPPPPPATTFTVTATVTGLAGSGLTLLDNGSDSKAVTADGSVTFATVLANAAPYAVTVGTQPTSPIQACTVTSGSGTIAGANVANVVVACATQNPRVAYSLNYYGGSSTAYVTDAATGQLRLRSVIKVGNTPISFHGDSAGRFLFYLNQGTAQSPLAIPPIPQTSSSLSAFTLNATGEIGRAHV